MIQFKHFSKSSTVGSGSIVFRQYTTAEAKSRFVQFIEGTIKELLPEDFEGVTTLGQYALSDFINLERIDMGDSVTTISSLGLSVLNPNLKEIVFSANLTSIAATVLTDLVYDRAAADNKYPPALVLNFSRAKQVPSVPVTSAGADDPFTHACITEVRVPQNLYSSWINSSWQYSKCYSKIVAV